MRVGIISCLHESNTFLPDLTPFEAFEADHVLSGPAVEEFFRNGHHEVSGFLDASRTESLEAVPVFAARAVPSGTIRADAADRLLHLMRAQLDGAAGIDGLLVALHGAAVAENHADFDGDCLALLRTMLGSHIPIICTLDPHANVSPVMVKSANALITYRSNPHLDQRERGVEAAVLMARTLRGEIQPVQVAALPPVAMGIEAQHTGRPPLRRLYERAADIRDRAGLLSVSVILGFPYADVREMGSGFVAVADRCHAPARQAVAELSSCLWHERAAFSAGASTVEKAIAEVAAGRGLGPIGLLDIGDNLGGGSPGDGTLLAHALIKSRLRGVVCLWDPPSADQARRAGVNASCRLRMGGRTGAQPAPPIIAEVMVRRLHDGRYIEAAARHGGMTEFDMGPTAVVEMGCGLTIVLTSQRVMPVSLAQLTGCGIDPARFDALILKGVHAPVAAYEQVCRTFILVDTPGVTRCTLESFDYRHRRRPLYPLERGCPCDLDAVLTDGPEGPLA